ncbi:MAG: transglutaminase domain-containing protein [Ferruginibacter sp.]
MKRSIKIIFISAFILIATNSFAQSDDYKAVDDYVKKVGSLDTLNVGSISAIVTQPFQDKINKARAIYDWIAYNIDFDCKNARGNNNDKSSSDDVLKYRKATPTGYANLFQDMCSVVEIRCLTVDGYTKNSSDDINNPEDETNDTWDVIQLGQTSSEWYYGGCSAWKWLYR